MRWFTEAIDYVVVYGNPPVSIDIWRGQKWHKYNRITAASLSRLRRACESLPGTMQDYAWASWSWVRSEEVIFLGSWARILWGAFWDVVESEGLDDFAMPDVIVHAMAGRVQEVHERKLAEALLREKTECKTE